MIGKTLGHYAVSTLIGRGGMGEVYKAKDQKLGRDVAIKVLPEEFAKDADRVARFQREAKLLASLNHPNIAAIHGLEESDGTHFLVLELIEGDTLADRIKSGPIPVEEALKLALQIAEALEAAHEKGVIHRDLKPANIKLTPDGKVKILDFGLAKAFAGEQADLNLSNSPTLSVAATQQGVILGTAAYMSPEQARGKEVDKRADIWAFGSVLYEMLTGRPAFDGEDVSEILAAVIKGTTDLNLLPPVLDRRIRNVIERCLQKDTHQRFRDIGDVRYELERTSMHPESPHRNQVLVTSMPHRRRMGAIVVAAVALGAVLAGFGVWFLTRPEPQAQIRLIAVTESDQSIGNGIDPDVILSPDGRQLLFLAGRSNMASASDLFVRDLDSLKPRLLADNARAPFFSTDGNWVFFIENSTKLKKVPVEGGPVLEIADISTFGFPRGFTWSADDMIIFATHSVETGLLMMNVEGDTVDVLTTPDTARGESDHLWPEMLPGGKAVLFTITNNESIDSAQIAVLNLDTKKYSVLPVTGSNPRFAAATGHIVYGVQGTLRAVAFDPNDRTVRGTSARIIEGVVTKPSGAASFSISHTGSLAYLAGTAAVNLERRVAWFNRSGQSEVLGLQPDSYSWPELSKDDSKLAIVTSTDGNDVIWTYDLGGATVRQRFTLEGSNTIPIWSPDGETITFASDREGIPGIWRKRADGRGVAERLTTAEEGTVHWPGSWSPDGKTLAFTIRHKRGGQSGSSFDDINIWTLSMATGEKKPFSTRPLPWREDSPQFSPDGCWLAYDASGDAGALEWNVYIEPFPPTDEKWQLTQTNGGYPRWPSSTELTYRPGYSGIGLELLRTMNVVTQPAISFGDEQEWPIKGFLNLDYINMYDVAQDGRFLVVTVSDADKDEGSPRQIILSQNWFEELKQRLPVD